MFPCWNNLAKVKLIDILCPMEHRETHNNSEHIVDLARIDSSSTSSSDDDRPSGVDLLQHEDRPSASMETPTDQTSLSFSSRVNSRNLSLMRRGDGNIRRRRSPLNSGLWISVELIVTVSQIVASIVILSLSKHENPKAPLFAWVVGYASGCVATLPILYWRFRNRNRSGEPDSTQSRPGSSESDPQPQPASYTAISVTQSAGLENQQTSVTTSRNSGSSQSLSLRLNGLVDHFKMALDCFFAVWFIVGNVWIFGGHSSPSDAPKLYRLCIVFLTFSCIGYAMPFILCATICCCLPCIISVLGFREDLSHTRGATSESINALPTYKFKLKKNSGNLDIDPGTTEGGVLAAGTEKERAISGEDAVCCICLAEYVDDDDLRELPCSHFFHMDCVDKWLKINASCPLCKFEVGESGATSNSSADSSQHPSERRVGNSGLAEVVYGSTVF